jgi:hypothetical protein
MPKNGWESMSHAFELLVIENHSALEHARAEVARVGGKLSAISQHDWYEHVLHALTANDGGTSSPEWIVLADHSAPLAEADFDAVRTGIAAAIGPIWLQPWNRHCSSGFYAWQSCSPQVACLWSNPSTSAAVCIRPRGLQRPQVAHEPASEAPPTAAVWNMLQQLVRLGEHVAVPKLDAISPWPSGLNPSRLPRLTPSADDTESVWLSQQILPLKPSQLVLDKRSDADSVAVKAGLFQWHGLLDESHQLSQSIEGLGRHRCGDYWHAINHRREPDYSNAKYWFRQLGSHPVFSQLTPFVTAASEPLGIQENWPERLLKDGMWDPFAFVDLCEACRGDEDGPLSIAARQLQAVEMQLLLTTTYRDAAGIV